MRVYERLTEGNMKRGFSILIVIVIMMQITVFADASDSVIKEKMTVTYTGGEKDITVVWVDMNDPLVRLDAVLADGAVGETATLEEIVSSANDIDGQGVAGINGSFFSAYTDMQPLGTLIIDGKVEQISNLGSVLSVSGNNEFNVDPLYVSILGGTNNQWEWPYSWYAWNVNHYYSDPSAVMIFDRYYSGPKPEHTFTSIVVDKSVVKSIVTGSFEIPEEGFLILTNDKDMIAKFQVGEQVDYKTDYFINDYNTTGHSGVNLDYGNVRTAIGAGPTLVKDGKIVLDGRMEGFTESKILDDPAQRSLIGVRADGYVGFASIPGVTMAQLAEIAINLGMVEAMNLDGGGSSGTFYDGNYITTPGRELSNALVVRYLYEKPIGIELNGNSLFFDTEPYVNTQYQRTLVPLRGIAEAIGAVVGWDAKTSSIVVTRGGTDLKLQTNSPFVYVNGDKKEMEIPVVIRDQRSYVPARFFVEYFGGAVDWRQADSTVVIVIDHTADLLDEAEALQKSEDYIGAVAKYLAVLKVDSQNIKAIKELAYIYNVKLNEKALSIPYYETALAYDSNDSASLVALAWVYYTIGRIDDAIDAFSNASELLVDKSSAYYGLGVCYSSYTMKDSVSAKYYFNLAIDNGLSGSSLDYAQNYTNTH
jgi:exopolysaccharide biosynthesis protein